MLAAVRAYLHSEIGWLAAAMGGAGMSFMAGALLAPDALAPLNRGWTNLGHLLHKVTNPIVLGGMYYLAVVPTGLVMRAFGADPMARKLDHSANYWVIRHTSSSTADSLRQPF